MLFITCTKQNPELFEFAQEYPGNFGQFVQIFNVKNELYYIDKHMDTQGNFDWKYGVIQKNTGTVTNLLSFSTWSNTVVCNARSVFYNRSDSLFHRSIDFAGEEYIGYLGKRDIYSGHSFFADNEYIYYLQYATYNTYDIIKRNISTNVEQKIQTVENVNLQVFQDNDYIYYVENYYTYYNEIYNSTNFLKKLNKTTLEETTIVETTEPLFVASVSNGSLYYIQNDGYKKTPCSPCDFPMKTQTLDVNGAPIIIQGSYNYTWNDGIRLMSYENSGVLFCKENIYTKKRENFASSLHGIQSLLAVDSKYLYVLQPNGGIGVLNL